jgi:BlaI family penicillinase repressor
MSALPTDRELEALKVLWEQERATVREIHQSMVSGQQDLAYTTVLSLVQTMERKELVQRETQGRGRTSVYTACVPADSTLRGLAGNFLDKVFDGAVSQYLVRALEAQNPSPAELDELEQMIARAKKKAGSQKAGGNSKSSEDPQ